MNNFSLISDYNGHIYFDEIDQTDVYGFNSLTEQKINLIRSGSAFGYVAEGELEYNNITIPSGFYFTIPNINGAILKGGHRIILWVKIGYNSFLKFGKWESDKGRLKYIDGCTDSVLINPIKKGDPCLNTLYMPEGVNQTMHTHPSLRSGFIIKGGAKCETPEGVFDLKSNDIFILKKDAHHKFRSDFGENILMKLIAYHPDSDFGAEDEIHPMINRTIVNGVSASNIEEIRTK